MHFSLTTALVGFAVVFGPKNVLKKWHVSCVCWCGWRLPRTRGSLWDLLVPHRPRMCVCEYISRTFALHLTNRVSWFCYCVWFEKCVQKKWHVSCVCWCGWRLRHTGGSLWDLLVPHRPEMCMCEYISRTFALHLANRVSWFCCCVWSEKCVKKNHRYLY